MSYSIIKNVLSFPFSLRQKKLSKTRSPLRESDFVQQIVNQGGDSAAASILYQELQEWTYVNDFTAYPTDSLGSVFGIAEEELDEDLILGILGKLNIPLRSKEDIASFGAVDTPLEIAKLVAMSRRIAG